MEAGDWLADLAAIADPIALIPRVTDSDQADEWQRTFLSATDPFVFVLASRGVGKSTTVAILAYHRAEMWPGQTVLLIAPTQRQASELFRKVLDVRRAFGGTQIAPRITMSEIELKNGSRVIALPASADNIRGFRADMLILDEACYIPDPAFSSIIPMMKRGARLIACSTPASRRGFFYERWIANVGLQIVARSTELPRMRENVERDRIIMPSHEFRTEHLLSWAGSGQAFFCLDDVAAMFTPAVKALDLGVVA